MLISLVLVVGCAPKAVTPPAAKPTEVWLRGSAAMTGIYSGSLLPASEALKEAVELVNKQGGIDGVTWKVELLDDGGDVARATANYEQLKAKEPKSTMMVLITTSGVAEALKARFNEDNIVCMLPSGSATALYPSGNSYCIVISHPDGFGFFCDWLAETQPKPIKLGFCNWDSTFGRSVLTEECLNYAKSKGVEVVATELFPITQMDVSTQLTKIKDAAPDVIFLPNYYSEVPLQIEQALRLGIRRQRPVHAHPWCFRSKFGLPPSLGQCLHCAAFWSGPPDVCRPQKLHSAFLDRPGQSVVPSYPLPLPVNQDRSGSIGSTGNSSSDANQASGAARLPLPA